LTDGISHQAHQGFRPQPKGQQLVEQVKEQARKPENRRKLEELRKRYGKGR